MSRKLPRPISYAIYALLLSIGFSSLAVLCYASMRDDICFDSTILLTEVERIAEGYVPYKTLHLNYPPLWFYMMAVFKWLFHVPYGCYNFYFAVNLLMLATCAFVIYKLSFRFCRSRFVSLATSWLFLFLCMINGGLNVLFEAPSLMFGLFGIWMTYACMKKDSRHYLWIGVLMACSFLVKQFGLGFIALAMLAVIIDNESREKWKKVSYLLCGFLFICTLVTIVFGKPFINSVFFNSYSSHLDLTIVDRLHNMSHMLRAFVRKVPVILSAILLIPAFFSQGKWRLALVSACGLCGFSLQFLFGVNASHYYMYMIPFAVLFIPIMYALRLTKSERLVMYVSFFFLLYVNIKAVANVTKIRIETHARELQTSSGIAIASVIPAQAKVWIANDSALPIYYFANLMTPNMEKHGYCAGKMQISESMAAEQIESADYVICSKNDESLDSPNIFFTSSLRDFVTSHESIEITYLGKSYLLCNLQKKAQTVR